MNIDLQLIALILASIGVLVTIYRRARGPVIMSIAQAYHFICGSAILSIVLVAAALIILAGCNPYVTQANPTSTVTARPSTTHDPPLKRSTTPALGAGASVRTPTPSPTCTVRTGIPAGTVNLRTGAGVRHAVLRVLSEGEILRVLERGAWLKVSTRGNTGFIYARYCQ